MPKNRKFCDAETIELRRTSSVNLNPAEANFSKTAESYQNFGRILRISHL